MLVIVICGIQISRLPMKYSNIRYWIIAVWAVLAYAIGEGLRWGHMVDYNSGCIYYNQIQCFFDDERNPIWSSVQYFLKLLGFKYRFFIFLQCSFLMFSIMVLVKNYHKYASYIMPIAIIAILMNENFIRWYMAFGFILIGIHYYINNKDIKALLFFLFALFTHFGYLFIIWLFILFKLLNRLELNPRIVCAVFVIADLFGNISWIAYPINELSFFLVSMGLDESVNEGFTYLTSTERLFNGDLPLGLMSTSMLAKMANLFIHVPVILWSKRYIKQVIPHYNSFYNIYVIGIIIAQLFMQVTLLGRFTQVMVFFFCIVGGSFYSIAIKNSKRSFVGLFLIFSMLLYFFPYIKGPFSREDRDMYFLWDSNGQGYNSTYQ